MKGTVKQVMQWLLEQDDSKQYEVKEYKEKRSLNANAFFHVLCQKVAEKTAQSLTEVKNQTIADYGQIDKELGTVILRDEIDWRKLTHLHLHPTTATRVLDDERLYRVYYIMRGSHTYDTGEMSRLIEGIVQEAKAVGVETLTPRELEQMIGRWKPNETE